MVSNISNGCHFVMVRTVYTLYSFELFSKCRMSSQILSISNLITDILITEIIWVALPTSQLKNLNIVIHFHGLKVSTV